MSKLIDVKLPTTNELPGDRVFHYVQTGLRIDVVDDGCAPQGSLHLHGAGIVEVRLHGPAECIGPGKAIVALYAEILCVLELPLELPVGR